MFWKCFTHYQQNTARQTGETRSILKERRLVEIILAKPFSQRRDRLFGIPTVFQWFWSQGSILGPLLFSIFINDASLLQPPGCRYFFADDTKVAKIVKCYSDCYYLQYMVNIFAECCAKNLAKTKYRNCNIISFYRKNQPLTFVLNRQTLIRVQQVKDLVLSWTNSVTTITISWPEQIIILAFHLNRIYYVLLFNDCVNVFIPFQILQGGPWKGSQILFSIRTTFMCGEYSYPETTILDLGNIVICYLLITV